PILYKTSLELCEGYSVLYRALLLSGLLLCAPVFAAEVRGLYETEVIANSPSNEDKNAAFKDALTVVLGRILAGDNVLQDRAVQATLANAPRFVKQHQYSLTEANLAADNEARNMRVLFDEQALLEALKTSKLKVWGDIRPETLLWLVVEENGRRSFYKADSMPELSVALSKGAKQKGLPLLYPLSDLDEQRQLSVNDVLSAYPQNLLNVSERYGVVSILAGRVVKMQQCWKGDWAFYFDDRVEQWSKSCGTLNEVVATGLSGVYTQLAGYYAAKPDGVESAGVVVLKIAGINGANDISRVTQYLQSLSMVKSVSWVDSQAGINRYQVSYQGNRHAFEESVGIGRVLNPQDVDTTGLSELRYRLLNSR
ncbi:MAG: DUF2066 domain-containing protein, partial [Methylococcaceae bacterium]|nr:DUF2066 domain-containing protein [Methylococcaceae bacterium]